MTFNPFIGMRAKLGHKNYYEQTPMSLNFHCQYLDNMKCYGELENFQSCMGLPFQKYVYFWATPKILLIYTYAKCCNTTKLE